MLSSSKEKAGKRRQILSLPKHADAETAEAAIQHAKCENSHLAPAKFPPRMTPANMGDFSGIAVSFAVSPLYYRVRKFS